MLISGPETAETNVNLKPEMVMKKQKSEAIFEGLAVCGSLGKNFCITAVYQNGLSESTHITDPDGTVVAAKILLGWYNQGEAGRNFAWPVRLPVINGFIAALDRGILLRYDFRNPRHHRAILEMGGIMHPKSEVELPYETEIFFVVSVHPLSS